MKTVENFINQIKNTLKKEGKIIFEAKILAGSRENKIVEVLGDNKVKIRIKAIREKGKANQTLIKFLEKEFNANAFILGGKTNSIKRIKLEIN